ncbi:MAG TPA: alpha/beta fold hydrolase [Acidimicrobiales bacterium]|nr:alpha/beta fold hydrolase [Acidimicrobiales bacterium]
MAFARNGDVRIYYETFGSRSDPPLLLVNGLGSQCISYRVEWCERFAAAGHFVVRYDNRDVGLSSKFADSPPDVARVVTDLAEGRAVDVPYRLSEMAADGLAVLDDLDISRAHVLGVSMGGMIVQTMAIESPDRLLTMTSVMSTTGDPDVGQPTREAQRMIMTAPARDRAGYVAGQLAGLRIWGSPACFDDERLSGNATEAFDRCFDPAGTARQMMAIIASGSRGAALGRVQVPTLVLHGDADTLVDPSGGRRTAESIPGARLVILEGMGHDYPPQYWDRIVELVRAHTGQGAV